MANELFNTNAIGETTEITRVAEKSTAFFTRLSQSVADSIKANRVVPVSSLAKMTNKDYAIMQAVYNIADTNKLTIEQIRKKVWASCKASHLAKNESTAIEYYTFSDTIRESDIIKAVMLISALFGGFHLTVIKASGELAVMKHLAKKPVITASLYTTIQYTDEETKDIRTKRLSVQPNAEFIAIMSENLVPGKTRVDLAKELYKNPALRIARPNEIGEESEESKAFEVSAKVAI